MYWEKRKSRIMATFSTNTKKNQNKRRALNFDLFHRMASVSQQGFESEQIQKTAPADKNF